MANALLLGQMANAGAASDPNALVRGMQAGQNLAANRQGMQQRNALFQQNQQDRERQMQLQQQEQQNVRAREALAGYYTTPPEQRGAYYQQVAGQFGLPADADHTRVVGEIVRTNPGILGPELSGKILEREFGLRQESAPTAIQNYEYRSRLSPAERREFDLTQRAAQFQTIGGVPTQFVGGQPAPLSTLDAETEAKRRISEATQTGQNRAKLSMDAPDAEKRMSIVVDNNNKLVRQLQELRNSPGLPQVTGSVAGREKARGVTTLVSQEAANAQELINTIKSQTFVAALQAMREASKTGGAVGNVSDREGDRLENALTALGQAQDPETYKRRLDELIDTAELATLRLQRAHTETYGEFGAAANPRNGAPQQGSDGVAEGATATNPQTGQQVIYRGGQWVPM